MRYPLYARDDDVTECFEACGSHVSLRAPVFKKGLNVSLGTDDPLQFHQSKDPLGEEYAVAAKSFGFTNLDMVRFNSI